MTQKRRKSKAERKDEIINVRVTADQKKKLKEKADRVGLTVSSFLLTSGLQAKAEASNS